MDFLTVKQAKNLKGKRVLVRAGLNVPAKNGKVVDDFRLRAILPTINYLERKGAKIILMGHIGRDPEETLWPVAEHFNTALGKTVGFAPELYNDGLEERTKEMGNGQILILENLRKFPGETENKKAFAKHLAGLGDVYVNEAFSASHRKHASIVGVPKLLPGYAGLRFSEEIKHLSKILNPSSPFVFILGGAKFKTKAPLLKKFTGIADTVFIGGALANNMIKAKGHEIGRSLVSKEVKYAQDLLKKDNVFIPCDVIVTDDRKDCRRELHEIQKTDKIVDAGPESVALLEEKIKKAKFVVWNGPLGFYEKGYDEASTELLKIIAGSKAKSIIGGGDTVTLVSRMDMEKDFTFVSSGGGAMLDFLEDGTLPGLEVLRVNK